MLSASLIASQISASLAPTAGGVLAPRLAAAIGQGVSAWAAGSSNVALAGVATGPAGTGVTSGGLVFSGTSVPALFSLVGFNGPVGLGFGRGVGLGLVAALNASARYVGVSPTVGSGVDVSKVVLADAATLQAFLLLSFAGQGVSGPTGLRLANELSVAIAGLFMTGVGRGDGIVSGVGLGPPLLGSTTSGIF